MERSESFNLPDSLLINKEFRAKLLEQINQLPSQYKEVIHLYYYSDLSYEEISKVTGDSIGTVKSRLFRAKKTLKESLQKDKRYLFLDSGNEGYANEKTRLI